MKKFNVLLLLALLVSTMAASAQSSSFGITAGTRISNYSISGISSSQIDSRTGFQVGGSWNFKVPFIEVGPEVIYSYSRIDLKDNSIYGEGAEIKVNSIDVPLVVGLSVFGPIKLQAGPVFSVYSDAKADLSSGGSVDIGRIKPEMGYTLGLQLVLLSKFVASARFYGEFDSHESDMGMSGSSYSVDNHSFAISVGARF